MTLPFTNQDAANAYAAAIGDSVDRVWVEYALSIAIGALVRRHNEEAPPATPVDLLLYAQLTHAAFRHRDIVETILSGRYAHFRDVPDLF